MNIHTDCSQLCEGLIIKNYKEMCSLLNEQVKSGASKRSQLKRWKRFFDFKLDGQKFVITKIYDIPFEAVHQQRNREGAYIRYIKPLLLSLLQNANGNIRVTRKELCCLLSIINNRYLNYFPNLDLAAIQNGKNVKSFIKPLVDDVKKIKNVSVDTEDIAYFYYTTEKKLYSIIHSSLKSMTDKSMIKIRKLFFIRSLEGDSPADIQQELLIYESFDEVLKSMEKKSLKDIIASDKIKEFYRKVNELVQEKCNCIGFYSLLEISSLSTVEPLNNDLRVRYKKELNNAVLDYFQHDMLAKKAKYNEYWGEPYDNLEKIKHNRIRNVYKEDFVNIQSCLLDYLIKIDDKKQTE